MFGVLHCSMESLMCSLIHGHKPYTSFSSCVQNTVFDGSADGLEDFNFSGWAWLFLEEISSG